MSLNIVRMPAEYFGDPNQGRPIFFGSIYVGEPDTDPEIEVNRKTVTLRQEDGTEVPIAPEAQPLLTGGGGYVLYNGSPVSVLVDGNYSVKVLDKSGVQLFYFDNVLDGAVLTVTDVASLTNINFSTVAEMVADTTLQVGNFVSVENYTSTNNSGVMFFDIVGAGTGTDDGGSFIDLPNTIPATQAKQIFHSAITPKLFGASGDGVTDDSAEIQALESFGKGVVFSNGTSRISSNLVLNQDVEFLPGADVTIDTGVTLTINGSVNAGYDQDVFSGLGRVVLNSESYPIHWFETVSQAVLSATANDTLRIYKETSFDGVNITKKLNFVGIGREYINVTGSFTVTDTGGNSTFNDIHIKSPTSTACITVNGVGGLNFRDCQLNPDTGNTLLVWDHTAGAGGTPQIMEMMQCKMISGKLLETKAAGVTYIIHVKEESLYTFAEANHMTVFPGGFAELLIVGSLVNISSAAICATSNCQLRFRQACSIDDTTNGAFINNNGVNFDTFETDYGNTIKFVGSNRFINFTPIFTGTGVSATQETAPSLTAAAGVFIDSDIHDEITFISTSSLAGVQTWVMNNGRYIGQVVKINIAGTITTNGNNVVFFGTTFLGATHATISNLTIELVFDGSAWSPSFTFGPTAAA